MGPLAMSLVAACEGAVTSLGCQVHRAHVPMAEEKPS